MIAPHPFKRPSVTRSTRSRGSASGICRTANTISLGVDAVPGGIGTIAVECNFAGSCFSVRRLLAGVSVSGGMMTKMWRLAPVMLALLVLPRHEVHQCQACHRRRLQPLQHDV